MFLERKAQPREKPKDPYRATAQGLEQWSCKPLGSDKESVTVQETWSSVSLTEGPLEK